MQTSGALCRVTSPRGAGSIPRLRGAPHQTRWDRHRVRTTDTERTRAPSIGSTRTSRPGRATSRSLFTCTASPRTLSPATNRACLVKGWTVASGYPTARAPRRLPLGSPRQRERCVSPTSATNARYEHPLDCPIPERGARATPLRARFRALPIHLRSKTSGGSPGGASLDGEPPASAWPRRPASWRPGCWPQTLMKTGTTRCAVLAKPRSKAPPRGATRQRSSRPRTEPMTSTSDALCRGPARTGSGLSAGPARWSRQARLRHRLVKGDRFVETRTPSLDECSLPRALEPCGSRERDHREPATVPTALPPRAGFRRPFTVRARGRMARPERAPCDET